MAEPNKHVVVEELNLRHPHLSGHLAQAINRDTTVCFPVFFDLKSDCFIRILLYLKISWSLKRLGISWSVLNGMKNEQHRPSKLQKHAYRQLDASSLTFLLVWAKHVHRWHETV